MSLKYQREWKLGESGICLPDGALEVFSNLIRTIATESTNPQSVFETMKTAFGDSVNSLNALWAEIDLNNAMRKRATNAPRFIEQIWCGLQNIDGNSRVPDVDAFNQILSQSHVPFRLNPPNLEYLDGRSY